MQRYKIQFEAAITKLTAENMSLSEELAEWKNKAESAYAMMSSMPKLTSAVSTSPSRPLGSASVLSDPQNTAADFFNQRMGRDHRFQKNANMNQNGNYLVSKTNNFVATVVSDMRTKM